MKFFIPLKKATLLIPSGPPNDPDRMHLFVLLTDPVTEERLVLICPINSLHPDRWHDPSCILCPNDHDFIQHDSFVNYSMARIVAAVKLDNGVRNNLFKTRELVSDDVYHKICQGLFVSRFTTPEIRNFLNSPL